MSAMKAYCEDVSVDMGLDGEINDAVMEEADRRLKAANASISTQDEELICGLCNGVMPEEGVSDTDLCKKCLDKSPLCSDCGVRMDHAAVSGGDLCKDCHEKAATQNTKTQAERETEIQEALHLYAHAIGRCVRISLLCIKYREEFGEVWCDGATKRRGAEKLVAECRVAVDDAYGYVRAPAKGGQ